MLTNTLLKARDEADKSGNYLTGFVTDHGVDNPAVRDFYLQSYDAWWPPWKCVHDHLQ